MAVKGLKEINVHVYVFSTVLVLHVLMPWTQHTCIVLSPGQQGTALKYVLINIISMLTSSCIVILFSCLWFCIEDVLGPLLCLPLLLCQMRSTSFPVKWCLKQTLIHLMRDDIHLFPPTSIHLFPPRPGKRWMLVFCQPSECWQFEIVGNELHPLTTYLPTYDRWLLNVNS